MLIFWANFSGEAANRKSAATVSVLVQNVQIVQIVDFADQGRKKESNTKKIKKE